METKGQLTERLKSEGRWKEYVAARAALVREGKMSPKQIRQHLATKFTPLTSQPPEVNAPAGAPMPEKSVAPISDSPNVSADSNDSEPAGELELADFDGRQCDEPSCVRWVFDHLWYPDVQPAEAPSSGAWTMLKHFRSSRELRWTFVMNLWSKLIPNKNVVDGSLTFEDDGTPASELRASLRRTLTPIAE